jgi:hypothetical protein
LTAYDYGTGGVWTYIRADSPKQILEKFRDLTVYKQPPSWMTEDRRRDIEARGIYDVDSAEKDPVFLARMLRDNP